MSGRSDSSSAARASRILGVGLPSTALGDTERMILAEHPPFAIVLFARNIESSDQLHTLIGEVRRLCETPPLFMIDEEGGRVDRMRKLIGGLPGASAFVECRDSAEVREFGRVVGRLLDHFAIEVNLAPVVDLWREGLSPSLTRRCFGVGPAEVAERAEAFIRGMAECGVASCIKHFPGLGLSSTDPHYGASVVDLTLEQLETADLLPYRKLADLAPSVMVSHGVYPRIDPSSTPGTLSEVIARQLLRETIGYEGLAITDDMEMHAVSDLATPEDIAVRSLLAGNDLVLFCSRIEELPSIATHIDVLASRDEVVGARLDEAARRCVRFAAECARIQAEKVIPRMGLDDVVHTITALNARIGGSGGDAPPASSRPGGKEWA